MDCSETNSCFPAPSYCEDSKCSQQDEFFNQLLNHDFINLNAHASSYSFSAKTNDGWYGVLTSSKLYKNPFNTNPVFSTIGCHSGTIDHGENKNANVFAFLANGASIFVGNTRYGWGSQLTSGLLSKYYLNLRNGQTSGEAIMNMKRKALEDSDSELYNAAIYEIQLYGDPTLKINME
ncbi:MAG: hypothetical protein KKF52_02640 [Nanoarchaeota archaeon]|nr:hypothetical protein [Nanoarchaeota archaeon]